MSEFPSFLRLNNIPLSASLVAQLVKNPPAMQETPVQFLGREDPLEKGYPIQYSWASLVSQMVKNLSIVRETCFNPWVGKIPCRKAWQPTLVFFLENPHGQRSLVGYSPWGRKESDTTEQLSTAQHITPLYAYTTFCLSIHL